MAEEEPPPPYADVVAAPTGDSPESLSGKDDVATAPASEPPSRAEGEVDAAEAATEPVDAVIEAAIVVEANGTEVEVEAPVELDETAASASGESTWVCLLPETNVTVLLGS